MSLIVLTTWQTRPIIEASQTCQTSKVALVMPLSRKSRHLRSWKRDKPSTLRWSNTSMRPPSWLKKKERCKPWPKLRIRQSAFYRDLSRQIKSVMMSTRPNLVTCILALTRWNSVKVFCSAKETKRDSLLRRSIRRKIIKFSWPKKGQSQRFSSSQRNVICFKHPI